MKTEERKKELESLIKKHQNLYYNSEPEISDQEFDKLWDELKLIDPENKLFKIVPKDSTDGFKKAEHIIPMGSQEKASNPESFIAWANKLNLKEYIVQYKLDGASLELQYSKGKFQKAVTRGDGKIGDDITENVKKMRGLITDLKINNKQIDFTGGIRCEVIMTKDVHREFFSDKANCRNAANGLMKRKDGDGSEYLTLISYDAVEGTVGNPFTGNNFFTNEIEKINWLQNIGFTTSPQIICKTANEVIEYRKTVMEKRHTLNYDIDGLVIKQIPIDPTDLKRARPEKQIAFKFNLEEAISSIIDVEWSISGATYTPIAIIEPVYLAGTTVKRASLANPNIIESLNLKIGSQVIVTKRGEIIPKIEKMINNPPTSSEISYPTICEVCNTKLLNEGTRLYCPNTECPKLIHHRIEKWISVLDMRDFGETLIKTLFDNNRLTSIYDIYTLTATELAELERMGERSAEKVINSINKITEIPLSKFIAGLDIDGIGETMAEKLIEAGYDTIDKLLNATIDEISKVPQFANKLATTLVTNLQTLKPEILKLLNSKKISITQPIQNATLSGKSFCFTGELTTMKRNDAAQLVKENGGIVKSSVVKDLTYLVTNEPNSGSSKNKKAQSLGIKIITEEEFLKLVKN